MTAVYEPEVESGPLMRWVPYGCADIAVGCGEPGGRVGRLGVQVGAAPASAAALFADRLPRSSGMAWADSPVSLLFAGGKPVQLGRFALSNRSRRLGLRWCRARSSRNCLVNTAVSPCRSASARRSCSSDTARS